MELRHLRYFTAVVQWKGYREASRHLHIAHPAISETVADLEQELDLKLFSRVGRTAQLTPEGEAFTPRPCVRLLRTRTFNWQSSVARPFSQLRPTRKRSRRGEGLL